MRASAFSARHRPIFAGACALGRCPDPPHRL